MGRVEEAVKRRSAVIEEDCDDHVRDMESWLGEKESLDRRCRCRGDDGGPSGALG